MVRTELFLDTAYAIALSSSKDEHYEKSITAGGTARRRRDATFDDARHHS